MGRRGNKKHLKRLAAPKQWMLDKLSGVWAPRPSTGPHKLRECLPLIIVLRNRLKYALTGREVKMILMNKLVQVDGKYRKDPRYPSGFMDVLTIPRTDQNFRILYDTKGRMVLVPIKTSEASYKLCKVTKANIGRGAIAYVATHDGRTIRFPDPDIKVGDSIKFSLKENKIKGHYKLDLGANVMVVKGRNTGRVGNIRKIEKHPGSYNIVHIEDARGDRFATRLANVFVIGADKMEITLPKRNGVKQSIQEETKTRLDRQAKKNM
jgi:small subunit ribosomal protein S4e